MSGLEVSGFSASGNEKREGAHLCERGLNAGGDESAEENRMTEGEAT